MESIHTWLILPLIIAFTIVFNFRFDVVVIVAVVIVAVGSCFQLALLGKLLLEQLQLEKKRDRP